MLNYNNMKKYLLVFFLFLLTGQTFADDFEVNGIYYNKLSDGKSVKVTNPEMVRGSIKDVGRDEDITDCTSYAAYHKDTVIIPSTITYDNIPYSVTEIGEGAFMGCTNLATVTIPNSVTLINNMAFCGCFNLTSVVIPNSVIVIGNNAFSSCTSLTNLTIPNSVIAFGDDVFSSCTSLTTLTIPNSVTYIGERAFSYCTNLTTLIIPNSLKGISGDEFIGCTR